MFIGIKKSVVVLKLALVCVVSYLSPVSDTTGQHVNRLGNGHCQITLAVMGLQNKIRFRISTEVKLSLFNSKFTSTEMSTGLFRI